MYSENQGSAYLLGEEEGKGHYEDAGNVLFLDFLLLIFFKLCTYLTTLCILSLLKIGCWFHIQFWRTILRKSGMKSRFWGERGAFQDKF